MPRVSKIHQGSPLAQVGARRVLAVVEGQLERKRMLEDLRRAGYLATGARNLAEALRCIDAEQEFALVLCDLSKDSGDLAVRLTVEITARWPGLTVLAVAGLSHTLSSCRAPVRRRLMHLMIEAVLERTHLG